jgi:hypothetical protein
VRIGNDDLQLDGTDMADPIASQPVWLGHILNYSIQAVFTGAPTGSFKIQASNDPGRPNIGKETPDPAAYAVNNWTDLTDLTVAIVAAGDIMWNVQNAGYRWIRLVYTPSGGTGTITVATFNVKGL